ncbi:hypothetical protein [Solemya velum gill symbiont]|uniref:Uncharacterized protein n=1 Tax=Solemya velum gill symbiont TaxID=2340 RepID=A0A0B0H4K5_SOVGS|nr:hypothetical protein [Solemya velum gill symbiont]KHF25143.1 hypothetical protein JV46_09830 [Solemya velum gill symbiont]OOY34866.1 hypothetical protein BOV88_08015 [Solemya velum gill symbiont]OOY37581.1 hypothetical protein BOV89_06850 [Solemya velum gill symbiont]OOY40624.1 hypothetical protein BOV90_03070 [Solemya velum gill symbiont]OOY43111.1 hypothetical protein BOV92_12060 [Solemya velum gill symbiont]
MNDIITWIIIAAFYAPLHYLLPVLFLFITGEEAESVRKQLIHAAILDSTLSMVIAFAVVILLFNKEMISIAMLILLLSMFYPFVRIIRQRKKLH